MSKSTQKRALSGRDFNQLKFIAMPAFGYELRSFIQRSIWVGPQDSQFFCRAQLLFFFCQLCLAEKLAILWADPDTTLNKRSELVAKCRHRNKFKLIKIPP